MSTNLEIFGRHDPATIAQMQTCLRVGSVAGGVLCADGHLGYAQPVGGVVAYESDVSISGVGFDIACGNMAVRLDTPYSAVKDKAGRIAKDVSRTISFGIGRRNAERVEHALFDSPLWEEAGLAHLKKMAAEQLGTVGAGNHYVDLFEDEQGLVWIGVHFGSRGLGHRTATQFLKLAGGRDGMLVEPTVVPAASELGRRYLAGMELAGLYAYAGREWVVERVRRIVGGAVTYAVHNHHNYAWRERQGPRIKVCDPMLGADFGKITAPEPCLTEQKTRLQSRPKACRRDKQV
jgi:tRNA-splicing ligase RtcB (3'-phosphate/5'-hydroxy nucleic acid ligase)